MKGKKEKASDSNRKTVKIKLQLGKEKEEDTAQKEHWEDQWLRTDKGYWAPHRDCAGKQQWQETSLKGHKPTPVTTA